MEKLWYVLVDLKQHDRFRVDECDRDFIIQRTFGLNIGVFLTKYAS